MENVFQERGWGREDRGEGKSKGEGEEDNPRCRRGLLGSGPVMVLGWVRVRMIVRMRIGEVASIIIILLFHWLEQDDIAI